MSEEPLPAIGVFHREDAGQQVGDVVYPFDDVEQASVAVAALEGRI